MTTITNDTLTTEGVMPGWMMLTLAAAVGLIAANIYYAQPLAGPIGASLGLPPQATGLIVTFTQIGYCLGLLLLVPLGDLIENRRLITIMIITDALALVAAGLSTTPAPFLIAALLIGLFSVAAQVLVPYASHMAPDASRGRAVGNVMSGLMLGIMLARPVSSFVTAIASWHAIFFLSAAAMVLLAAALAAALPTRVPASKASYGALLASMARLALGTPVLQRRALYQTCLFSAFSLFWTTVPLLLAGPQFQLSQKGIALFALAGVAGAIASPIAGRLADRGLGRPASAFAMLCALLAFLVTHLAPAGSMLALGFFVAAAVLLDFGLTTNMVVGQRALFALGSEFRSRLNGLYMATFFIGGAIGSAAGGWAYAQGGWALTSWIGAALPVAALLYFATEAGRPARSKPEPVA